MTNCMQAKTFVEMKLNDLNAQTLWQNGQIRKGIEIVTTTNNIIYCQKGIWGLYVYFEFYFINVTNLIFTKILK